MTFGCGLAPLPPEATSLGFANSGTLLRGVALPEHGDGFARAKNGEDTRWGTPDLVALLERASAHVQSAYPGTEPLYIGDLSARYGGSHDLHGSHRTGRDVDVLFYLTDLAGRSTRGRGFFAFDARGVSVTAELGASGSTLAFFDVARNWALVRALVLDEHALVQWIFCADGIKARLLTYAAEHEREPEALVRAAYVLHQPSRGRNHDDHFHVRIGCSALDRARGCEDAGPVWPWFRNEHEKPAFAGEGASDAVLVRALLGD